MKTNSIKLSPPFAISARLLPAIQIGGAWISLEYSRRGTSDGRTRYQWAIDLPDGSEHTGDDLKSGCGGGDLQGGFVSLLSFLAACGESVKFAQRTGREGENADLFPAPVAQWAADHTDDLMLVELEIEESAEKLIEE